MIVYKSVDLGNNITGIYANPQSFPVTAVDDGDSSVVAFISVQSVPRSVTRRQYYMQGVAQGWFTQAQALALIQLGTLPPSVVSFVNSLPANQQFAANMYLVGEQIYYRNNPLLISMTAAGGITSAQMDAFFKAASLL